MQTVSESGEIENQYDYDIFGNPTLTVENYLNSIRYAGEFYDAETGLYYLRARYYDPYIGRFISEDSYWGEDNNPLSLNLYTYAHNDPLKYIDPTGHAVVEGAYNAQPNKKKDKDKDDRSASELRKEQERRRKEEVEKKRRLEEMKRQEEARKKQEEERKRQEEERKKKEEEVKKKEETARKLAEQVAKSQAAAAKSKQHQLARFEESQASKGAAAKPAEPKPTVAKAEPKQAAQQASARETSKALEQEKQIMKQASKQGNGGTSSTDVKNAVTSAPEKKAEGIMNTVGSSGNSGMESKTNTYAAGTSPSLSSVAKNFGGGMADAGKDAVAGAINVAKHPLQTAKALGNAAMNPIATGKAINKAVTESVTENVINGDADTRARFAGRLVAEVGLVLVGPKAVDKAAKLADATLDAAKATAKAASSSSDGALKMQLQLFADDAAAGSGEAAIRNPLPDNGVFSTVMKREYAEAIADKGTLAGKNEFWITAADDMSGITTRQGAAERLALVNKSGQLRTESDAILSFKLNDYSGMASPFNRNNPGFIPGGLTGGGAREWVIPGGTNIINPTITYLK